MTPEEIQAIRERNEMWKELRSLIGRREVVANNNNALGSWCLYFKTQYDRFPINDDREVLQYAAHAINHSPAADIDKLLEECEHPFVSKARELFSQIQRDGLRTTGFANVDGKYYRIMVSVVPEQELVSRPER